MLLFAGFCIALIVRANADGECMSNDNLGAPCTILSSENPGTCTRRQIDGTRCKKARKSCSTVDYGNEGWIRGSKCKYEFVCADRDSGLEEIHNTKEWDCKYLEPCDSNANLDATCTMTSGNLGTCKRIVDASTCNNSIHSGCPSNTKCNYKFGCEDNISDVVEIHAEQGACKYLEPQGQCAGNANLDTPCTMTSGNLGTCKRSEIGEVGSTCDNSIRYGCPRMTKCNYNFMCKDNVSDLEDIHTAQGDCKYLDSEGHCEGNENVDAPCTIMPSGNPGTCSRIQISSYEWRMNLSFKRCKDATKCLYRFVCGDIESGLKEVHMAKKWDCKFLQQEGKEEEH